MADERNRPAEEQAKQAQAAEQNRGFFARMRDRISEIFNREDPAVAAEKEQEENHRKWREAEQKEHARGMEKLTSMGCEVRKTYEDGSMTLADRNGREFDLASGDVSAFVVKEATVEKAAVEGQGVIDASAARLGLTDANIEAYIGHLADAKAFAEESGLSHEQSVAVSQGILWRQNGLEPDHDFESWKNFVTPEYSPDQIFQMVNASRDGIDLARFDFPSDIRAEKMEALLTAAYRNMPETMLNALVEQQASLDTAAIERLGELTRILTDKEGQLSPEAHDKLELVVAAALPNADGSSLSASDIAGVTDLIRLDQSHTAPEHEPLDLSQISTIMDNLKAEL